METEIENKKFPLQPFQVEKNYKEMCKDNNA